MALVKAVQGGVRPSPEIVWKLSDGSVLNLSGASLTGWIHNPETNITRAISGDLSVSDAAAGKFTWDYAAADVAEAGKFEVQFNAAFAAGPSPARHYKAKWEVEGSLG